MIDKHYFTDLRGPPQTFKKEEERNFKCIFWKLRIIPSTQCHFWIETTPPLF